MTRGEDGPLDPRDYDLRRLNIETNRMDCPNGPDPETGEWPCDPKGYSVGMNDPHPPFGVLECQVCGLDVRCVLTLTGAIGRLMQSPSNETVRETYPSCTCSPGVVSVECPWHGGTI